MVMSRGRRNTGGAQGSSDDLVWTTRECRRIRLCARGWKDYLLVQPSVRRSIRGCLARLARAPRRSQMNCRPRAISWLPHPRASSSPASSARSARVNWTVLDGGAKISWREHSSSSTVRRCCPKARQDLLEAASQSYPCLGGSCQLATSCRRPPGGRHELRLHSLAELWRRPRRSLPKTHRPDPDPSRVTNSSHVIQSGPRRSHSVLRIRSIPTNRPFLVRCRPVTINFVSRWSWSSG